MTEAENETGRFTEIPKEWQVYRYCFTRVMLDARLCG